jgi:predicted glutamine amidotransferase
MCRLFFSYKTKNAKKKLHEFLKQTHHRKKYTPGIKSTHDDIPVKDGFGIAYFVSSRKRWSIYKQPTTYDNDPSLERKITTMSSNFIIGHLRGIIIRGDSDLCQENTHPFQYKNAIFVHNGYIRRFRDHMTKLHEFIEPHFLPYIIGKTDSEIIFYMYLSEVERIGAKNSDNAVMAMRSVLKYINNLSEDFVGNFVFSNTKYSIVTRYINIDKDEPPSLYFDTSDGGLLITSEPITENFQVIPKNTIMYMDNETGMFSFLKV